MASLIPVRDQTYQSLPKVLLHDHLDGGLRPSTVIDLANRLGYQGLPTADEDDLAAWFYQGDSTASLERYLEAFTHTFGVMQDADALRRTVYEAAQDLARDGVVYAEIRFGPSLHTAEGMTRAEVIEAALEGARSGEADFGIPIRLIIDALRQADDSVDVAEAASGFAGSGVVGFDLAGPEAEFPPELHRKACDLAQSAGLGLTIHAGEGAGVPSIAAALAVGAQRLGHGARIVEDTIEDDGEIVDLGPVAAQVRDDRVPLELAPTSNLHTSMYPDAAAHPLGMLHRAGFTVTLNTDNRLMSRTSMSQEFALAAENHGFELDDFRAVTMQALDAAFCDEETRERVRDRVVAGYAEAAS